MKRETYLLNELCQTSSNVLIKRGANFSPRNMLQGREHGVLNLSFDSHLHHASRVPCELRRD
jgi:hypothetical protein